jgi:syntenin-1
VNGQNVVGIKDKDVARIIDEAGPSVTVTVIPAYLYEHIIKKSDFLFMPKSGATI